MAVNGSCAHVIVWYINRYKKLFSSRDNISFFKVDQEMFKILNNGCVSMTQWARARQKDVGEERETSTRNCCIRAVKVYLYTCTMLG